MNTMSGQVSMRRAESELEPGATGRRNGLLLALLTAVALLGLILPASASAAYDLQVSTSSDRSSPSPLEGKTTSGDIYVFVAPQSGPSQVRFYLDDATMTGTPFKTEGKAPWDFAGTASDGTAMPYNVGRLSNGSHEITAAIDTSSGTEVVTSTFNVSNPTKGCGPLQCSEALVDLPYQLDFNAEAGKIKDANGVGTGFTYLDVPSKGVGYIPENLRVEDSGSLSITTTRGLSYLASNNLDNGLGVGIDAPSQVSLLQTTILTPPAGSGSYEQAGLWWGNDEDDYVKLVVLSTPDGTRIQMLREVGGERTGSTVTSVLSVASSNVTLSLKTDPSDRTVLGSYRINGGPAKQVGKYTVPGEFFSFDAAGIDPTIGTRTFGGIFASHRSAANPLTYQFDDFSVTDAGSAAPPPAEDSSFRRTSFSLGNPTSMAFGPDGRLYVSEVFGAIHALTLGADHTPVAAERITTLGSRLTLGLTIDPESTPDNVKLWVSHSSPSFDNGEPNSSTVTKLSGPGFTNREDVITGLPRAKANHAVNSIHFGPDGRLYIAVGGNTGAGAPNNANTEFGTMEEQPLSAAMAVADVRNPSFDGSCANETDIFGPPPCDVTTWATGLRNTYDFAWHTNGSMYGPDNGLGVTGTYPPSPQPPCFGFGSTDPWNQGGHNPGEQPDNLNRIEEGRYYGHPNPYRDECVFQDGRYQGVAAPVNWKPPIFNLGAHRSANGTIEYRANAFCDSLKGELLIANYSVGDNITRQRLAADGNSVASSGILADGFKDPLPVTEGPDGTIYVGEFGADKITALEPVDSGCWTSKAVMPEENLDAGGTALGGKVYVVAGKTAAGHHARVHVYDPTSDSWATAPNLPGPGVENPSVVAHDGKLYAFGGSADPFSGAVGNAAVFDPATQQWKSLPPMPTARGGAAAGVIDGKLYVAGGMDGTGSSVDTVEVFDPATESWSTKAPIPTRRDNPGGAVLDGKLYLFGGRTRNADGTTVPGTPTSVEAYDPVTDTWSAKASMPTGRRTMMVGRLRGRAQVMGGEATASGGAFKENEEYDPVTDTWRKLRPMQTPRHGGVAGTVDGAVYVISGGPTAGRTFSNLNEAFAFQRP